jgi:hypothetical protein
MSGLILLLLSATATDVTASTGRVCVRAWVRVPEAPPQVHWCGRAVLAENLLVPEAEALFARSPLARELHVSAIAASRRSKIAAGITAVLFGLSLVTLMGSLPKIDGPPGAAPSQSTALGVVVGLSTLVLFFAGSVVSLVMHGLASDEALRFLEQAVAAL